MKIVFYIYSKKKILKLIIVLLIIKWQIYYINIEPYINFIKLKFKTELEYKKKEEYFKNLKEIKILKRYKKIERPKISIISPIYNSEKFLFAFLKSIQNQNFNKIEILLIDDCSLDNSLKIIEKFVKIDQRVILIKNRENKGTFINRNIGFLFSKGEYVILPDPDDIISKNILNICYVYAKKYNFDIIRFNFNQVKGNIQIITFLNQIQKKPLFQPELSTYIGYGNNELKFVDNAIWNKFIKKEAFTKALYFLKKYYLNIYIKYSEDLLFNFFLYKVANSFFFISKIGYYYLMNELSLTNSLFFKKPTLKIKHKFILLNLFLEYSKVSKLEIDIINLLFPNFNINENLYEFRKNYNFYYNIIKILFNNINSKFISKENKRILLKIKFIIEEKMKQKK